MQQQTKKSELLKYVTVLEHRVQDINTEVRKKKSKQSQEGKQQRLRILQNHIDSLKYLAEILELINIEENQWRRFISLLETLYLNYDNPEHEQELKTLMDSFRKSNKAIKLTIEPFDVQAVANQAKLVDQSSQGFRVQMLEMSFLDRPQYNDYYQPPEYKEKLNHKSLFPTYKMLPVTIFEKLSLDTLIYIFYYFKESTEQQMAAQVLLKKDWIFHIKHCLWMKTEKTEETENEIKGSFLYYEIDQQKWQPRKKNDFIFKKKYIWKQE